MLLREAKQILNNNGYILEDTDDEEYQLYLKLKKKYETKNKENANLAVKIGDIFVERYSWEYTVLETFYKVIDVTKSSLKLAELEVECVEEGGIGRPAKYKPINKINKKADIITKRYKVDEDGYVKIASKDKWTTSWYKYNG